eukprot:2537283-Rhodomonas_salina.1
MPVEEVREKEPQEGSAESQPQTDNGVKRGRGRPRGTRDKQPCMRSNKASAESVSGDEGGEERSGNCAVGGDAPVAESHTAQGRYSGRGRSGGGVRATAANQGAGARTKKKNDKEVRCIPQGRPRQNNPPHNARGPSPSDSTAADPKNNTKQTDSHPDFVHADVDANPESGSFTAREDEALVEIRCQHDIRKLGTI